jgi:DNA-binding protein H-NS
MYRRAKNQNQASNKLSALIKRQALAKKFPITADQLAELAREAVASKPATICPPGEHPQWCGRGSQPEVEKRSRNEPR